MIELFILVLIIFFLAIASYTDALKREVPDWLNYSAIALAFFLRIMWSINTSDWHYFIYGFIGFVIFFLIGCGMYYLGQWGGGDAKLMMALGIFLGIEVSINNDGVMFLSNLLIVSLLYSLAFLFYLFIKNIKNVIKKYSEFINNEQKMYRGIFMLMFFFAIVNLFLPLSFTTKALFFIVLTSPALYYFSIFTRSIEICCMQRLVDPKELTEGDWIVNDVNINGKKIYSVKDLGVSKQQIKELIKLKKQKKINNVLMKIGIPFIPCFFLTFIVNLYFGNLLVKLFELLLR